MLLAINICAQNLSFRCVAVGEKSCKRLIFCFASIRPGLDEMGQTHCPDDLTLPSMLGHNIDRGTMRIKGLLEPVRVKEHSEVLSILS